MKHCRMRIFYSGSVQGVGFRYTTKTVATGFEVTGTVRNLPDGRVELVAEGARAELEAFRAAIRDAGLSGFIRDENVAWSEAQNELNGFEIIRQNKTCDDFRAISQLFIGFIYKKIVIIAFCFATKHSSILFKCHF